MTSNGIETWINNGRLFALSVSTVRSEFAEQVTTECDWVDVTEWDINTTLRTWLGY